MAYILVADYDDQQMQIKFPVPEESITLDDLQSAFPKTTTLRYKDKNTNEEHHVLCRENKFCVPKDGWFKEGRIYFAIRTERTASRVENFSNYRREVALNRAQFSFRRHPSTSARKQASKDIYLNVGIGYFKRGKFTKITGNNTRPGGIVTVGPFDKTKTQCKDIKEAAFEKFRKVNRDFRRKYTITSKFVLVYPDGTSATRLPDGSDEFSIETYRNFLNPTLRYDRLRLYLCEKREYELNRSEFEIVTDSSTSGDEDLPDIDFSTSASRNVDKEMNNTQSTYYEVKFDWNGSTITDTFPSESTVQALIDYLTTKFDLVDNSKSLLLQCDDQMLNPDDRLFTLSAKNNTLDVCVKDFDTSAATLEEEERNTTEEERSISSNFHDDCGDYIKSLVDKTVNKLGDIMEPTAILRAYSEVFLKGRPLDVVNEDQVIEGETSMIFVSRMSILQDALAEIQNMDNIRYPLEVSFYGEMAQDLGGPRREFFASIIKEIRNNFLEEEEGKIKLKESLDLLANYKYFCAGLLIGLSVLEGGPAAPYLSDCLRDTKSCEYKQQFEKGLDRVGLLTLMSKKNSLDYIFRRNESRSITLNRLLGLIKVEMSENGTNSRIKEEAAYRFFVKYCREVHAGRRNFITLQKILLFITGAEEEPLLGFTMQPVINFADVSFPMASTCINKLTLPLLSESDAKDRVFSNFDLAFVNEYFGLE